MDPRKLTSRRLIRAHFAKDFLRSSAQPPLCHGEVSMRNGCVPEEYALPPHGKYAREECAAVPEWTRAKTQVKNCLQ